DEKQATILDEAWTTGNLFATMVWYARLGHDPTWFKSFTNFEARASLMRSYSGQLIPALLQTPAYARALLLSSGETEVDKAVSARMARQAVLERKNPLELWVLLSESVLQCRVGGARTMQEQLARLLELSELPNVLLRVVPNSAGAHPGLDGPFKIIKVREGEVAFVEAPNGGRLVVDAAEVEDFRMRFDRIGTVALPIDSSRILIQQLMETMT
ncbi:MAG: hypothetical protein IRY90_09855, partial [Actinomadura rubrobrunea]|nr:hypothetical protein [Actinomadura rubrobrunea]